MRILGIDPGYGILGWSIIDDSMKLIDFGVIETSPDIPFENRIYEIHLSLKKIISAYSPDCVAIEKLFFAKNTKTALNVAKAIGAIILTLKMSGLDYFEYTPTQVKQALTGFGRASKNQMQCMIMKIFKIKEIPEPDDAADALAVALCHSFSNRHPGLGINQGC